MLKNISDATQKELRAAAREYRDMVIDAIENQKYDWERLSDSWASYKAVSGLDPRAWVAQGDFIEALKASEVRRAGKSYYAGLYVDSKHYSGLAMAQLAIFLEYGTVTIPPRPLFRPVAFEWEEKFRKNFVARVWKEAWIRGS